MVSYPRKHYSSYSLVWEPQISHGKVSRHSDTVKHLKLVTFIVKLKLSDSIHIGFTRHVLLVYSVGTVIDSLVKLGRTFQSCGLLICVFFLSQVPDIWSTSPPPYSGALHSSTSSTLTEDNEPVQQANVSVASDTRTQGKDENKLSDSCQTGRADNITLPEARPIQHSGTELHM